MNHRTPVESPVRGNSHAGFGGRPAETERPKGRHRAAGRPYLANRALDDVRREYWNQLRRSGDLAAARRFKDARWSLLKSPPNLTDKQTVTLRKLKHAGGEVWRAYTLKEALRAIFAQDLTVEDVTVLLDRFVSKASRSRLEPFVKLARTIRQHHDGILHAIRLGINQGRTEALNNKVRLITRRAYGFHSANAPRSH